MTNSCYLAGPMRGYPEFNFPAFDRARERLRNGNWEVFCPAEHDRANGFDPDGLDGTDLELSELGFDMADALAWDLARVCEADAIVLLPGWSRSSGARHELATANLLGKLVRYYDLDLNDLSFNPLIGDRPHSTIEVRTTSSSGGEKGVKPERFDLVPVEPQREVARVYAFGAEKYEDNNWRKGYEWSKAYAAGLRHFTAFWSGEDLDPESGLSHLAHVEFHCNSLIEWADTHPEFDDRYKADVA